MTPRTKALTLSLGFHTLMATLALWVLSLTHPPMETLSVPLKSMTLVSLSEPQPRPVFTPPVPVIEVPVPITKTLPKEPLAKPSPVALKTLPVTEKTPFQPDVSAVQEDPAVTKQSVSASESSPVVHTAPAAIAPQPKVLPKADLRVEKQNFYSALRSKIQQHLRYPTAARRRGMEGEVNVRFVLENGGLIHDVNIKNGESIFHDAAKLAVASASGVKIPDVLSESFPAEIDLTLEFRLN